MPETEPIRVKITADTEDLERGLDEGTKAIDEFGLSAERTERRTFTLVRQSTNLLGSILAIRGAFSITTSVLKETGLLTEQLAGVMRNAEIAIQAVVVALQIYRAISSAAAIADLFRAKAAFLAAIAQVAAVSLFTGVGFAIAASLAAWAAISALNVPRAQFGGIVPPRTGGTHVIMSEAGQAEAIIPLNRAREFGFGGTGDVNINIERIVTEDPEQFARVIGRYIQIQKGAGY